MQSQQEVPLVDNRKELLLQKRLKAKEKTADRLHVAAVTRQQLRKQRNRQAAQKSRDRKRQFIQTLERENNLLRGIINQCSSCSQQCESLYRLRGEDLRQDEQSILVNMTQTDNFMREQSRNDENSASGLSKYFWFTCLLIVLCMANFKADSASSNRELVEIVSYKYMIPPEGNSVQIPQSNLSVHPASKALIRNQEANYCTQCLQCLKNRTVSNNTLTLLSSEEEGHTANKTTSNIIFCPSKVQFFSRIYEALSKEGQGGNKEVSRLMVKGRTLKQMLKEDCFKGEEIREEEQYAISFTLAIFEIEHLRKAKSHMQRQRE